MATRYCLDANVFIQAKNGPYGMDFHPSFWKWIDRQADAGILFSSKMVFEELSKGGDELAKWVKERRDSKLFLEPSAEAYRFMSQIADYINTHYPAHQAKRFLNGADPWIVAQSKAEGATVVTHERRAGEDSKVVKIPNICDQLKVDYIDPFKMLRLLKARF